MKTFFDIFEPEELSSLWTVTKVFFTIMTNLNTTSIDDLKYLEGIGTQQATTIINLRDEKGYINMKDIEEKSA